MGEKFSWLKQDLYGISRVLFSEDEPAISQGKFLSWLREGSKFERKGSKFTVIQPSNIAIYGKDTDLFTNEATNATMGTVRFANGAILRLNPGSYNKLIILNTPTYSTQDDLNSEMKYLVELLNPGGSCKFIVNRLKSSIFEDSFKDPMPEIKKALSSAGIMEDNLVMKDLTFGGNIVAKTLIEFQKPLESKVSEFEAQEA